MAVFFVDYFTPIHGQTQNVIERLRKLSQPDFLPVE